MANKKRIALMVLLVFILQCVPVAVLAADYDFFPFGFGFGAFEDEETLREDAIENIKEMFDGLNEAIEKINGAVEEINKVIEEEDIFEDEDCDVEAVLEDLDKIMRKHFPNINQRRGLVNREDLIDEIETVVERELNALDGKKLDAEEALEDIMAEVTKVVNRELRNYPSRSGGNLAIDNIIAKFQKKNRELMRKLDWLTLFGDNKMGYYDDFYAGPSPVASWDFDEGRGDRTRCRGINGLDGRLFGAEWAKGVMGSALYFDGNAFVETPHDRALNNGRAISVEAWICPEDSGLYQRIITKTAGRAGEDYDYCLFSGDRENVGFAVKVGRVAYSVYSPAYSVPIGKWTHVIGVYNGRDIYIFLNGKEVARNQACGPMNDRGGHLRIGGDINPSQFNGRIDEVKIYNVALSGDDGIARYDESLPNKPYYNSDNYDNGYGYSYNYGYNNSYNNYKNNYGNYNYPVRSYRSWENDFDSQLNYFRHLREYFAHSRTWY